MLQLPLYPQDYDRDFWIESLLCITEDNATDTALEQHLELAREAVYPYVSIDKALELLREHRTEWQDYFHAKKELRERLLKMFGGVALN